MSYKQISKLMHSIRFAVHAIQLAIMLCLIVLSITRGKKR